jgi:signal transduction histidine kinase
MGRVFMLDKLGWGEHELTLAEIVASRITMELEHYVLRRQLADKVAATERIRLARDLHDGVLQSLTAAGLQLKAVARHLNDKAKMVVDSVLVLLLDEQRRIRLFVEGRQLSINQSKLELRHKMLQLVDQYRRHWGCEITVSVTPENITIQPELGEQLDFILAEAIANAVRHGQASRVDVTARRSSDHILLWIKDNGHGLKGAVGVYTEADLVARSLGPVSVRARIAELNGSLALSSSPEGVELRIELCT